MCKNCSRRDLFQSWHKISGKSKDRLMGNTFEESTDRLLLSCMARLICVEPTLLIRERVRFCKESAGNIFQNNSGLENCSHRHCTT